MSRRIVVQGYYAHGNFGDDLMGIMCAKALQRAGFDPVVVGLQKADAEDFGIRTCDSAHAALATAEAIVYGGGGMFIRHETAWPAIVESTRGDAALLEKCKERGIPVFGVSLGGSGAAELADWQIGSIKFAREARWISVRNPEDIALVEGLGGKAECHADLVWAASEFYPAPAEKPRAARVAASLDRPRPRPKLDSILDVLFWRKLARLSLNCEVVELKPHTTPGVPSSLRRIEGGMWRYQFGRLKEDLAFLAGAAAVFTKRLHVGVTTMSYGGAMISYRGEDKARLLMERLDMGASYISAFKSWRRLMRALESPARLLSEFRPVETSARAALIESASRHLTRLVEELNFFFADRKPPAR